jgi:hypothetical protein
MNTTDSCWKKEGHEMRAWAEECDILTPNELGRHGLGSLDEPCQLEPGEPCPACGKVV